MTTPKRSPDQFPMLTLSGGQLTIEEVIAAAYGAPNEPHGESRDVPCVLKVKALRVRRAAQFEVQCRSGLIVPH